MINSSFLKKFILGISIISFASCDTDYNDIGADIIDDDVHHDMIRYNAGLTAYDRPTGAVQANNLDVNMVGVLDNTVFGKTIAHFVTQVEMESVNPTITENAVIDSVNLYVPYYSTVESTTTGAVMFKPLMYLILFMAIRTTELTLAFIGMVSF